MTASSSLSVVAGVLALSAVLVLQPAAPSPPALTPPPAASSAARIGSPAADGAGDAGSTVERDTVGATGTADGVGLPAEAASGEKSGDTTGASAALTYEWPTRVEVPVLREFDRPDAPWASGHRGVDLAMAVGAPVHAAADGVVAFAGVVVDRPVVSVQHPDGVRTTYEPVSPTVVRGHTVAVGDIIGHLATGGHCAACLHWGARRGSDDYLDPLSLLRDRAVIRLLPG